MKDKKIILFAPDFFGYDKSIKNEMERHGAEVTLYDERPFRSFLGRVILRLNFGWLCSWYIEHYFQKLILPIVKQLDYLVLINPESISPRVLKFVKAANENLEIITYMWDSFENKKWANQLIESSDSFFTFDPLDAEKFNLKFLPLFYIPEYSLIQPVSRCDYDLSFIGTAHSERYKTLETISKGFSNVFVFLYTPSRLVFLYKKYICKELIGLDYRDVSSVPMSRDSIIDVVAKSKAIIDINHPSQIGLTMRTIEVLGAKRKLITTNDGVKNYDFYNENNILIFRGRESETVVSEFLEKPYLVLDSSIYNRYSLSGWIENLFL